MIVNQAIFLCRHGKDVGRSVTARGLWCDILCGPYHSFGTLCEDTKYYQRANKEFKYTSVDISERNVLDLSEELNAGRASILDGSSAGHRALAARGPTDLKAWCFLMPERDGRAKYGLEAADKSSWSQHCSAGMTC